MLVIDACALIEILTVEPSEIPELNNRVRASEWMSAPALIDYEVLNVLRKMATRGDIDEYLAEESRLVLRNLRRTGCRSMTRCPNVSGNFGITCRLTTRPTLPSPST